MSELDDTGATLYEATAPTPRAAVVAAAERRWDRDHEGSPMPAPGVVTSEDERRSHRPIALTAAGAGSGFGRRYEQLQTDAASASFTPAYVHWAALDLAPSSHVPAQEEPFNTIWAPVGAAADVPLCQRLLMALKQLGRKLKGKGDKPPQHFARHGVFGRWKQHLGTFLLCFLTMLAVSALHYHVFLAEYRTEFFVAPFGATVAIIFSLTDSDAAQPRNVIIGHVVCGVIGVSGRHLFAAHGTEAFMVAGPLALALSTTLLQVFSVSHPPALSTVLLAVYAPDAGVAWAGYFFIVLPIITGLAMILVSAWFGNNLVPGRHYPCYW